MDTKPVPFVPPAPKPRTSPPSMLEMIRIVYRNPLELWGEPSYNEPWISVSGTGGPLVIANDPGLIRYILVDNARRRAGEAMTLAESASGSSRASIFKRTRTR